MNSYIFIYMKSVIYSIKNIVNNKRYVGSAVNFSNRKSTHICNLKKNIHHNQHLQNAWNKYGAGNFIFELLLECPREFQTECEQYYINNLKPEYNKRVNAENNFGVKRPDVVLRNKVRAEKGLGKGENHPLFGKHHKAESIEKMIKFRTGKPSHRRKKVIKCSLEWEELEEFDSILEASKKTNTHTSNIDKVIKGIYTHTGGFKWKYKN